MTSHSMRIEFDIRGAAFDGAADRLTEIARVLDVIERKVVNGHTEGIIYDVNGNRIGEWAYTPWEEAE